MFGELSLGELTLTLLVDDASRKSDCVSTALSTPSGLINLVTLNLL